MNEAAKLLNSPRRGPVPDRAGKNFERQLRNITKLFRLGQRYRATVTKKKRGQKAWIRFLRKNGPEFIGKHQ